jgi:hypothetical protein
MLFLLAQLAWTHEPSDFEQPFDVLIVPGCPSREDGHVSSCQWKRAFWAAELYHGGAVLNLVVSGAAVYNPYSEAEALAASLRYLGVPEDRIVLETQARHTDENAAYSLEICQDRGWESIAVASSGPHAVVMDKMLTEWGADAFGLPLVKDRSGAVPNIPLIETPGWRSPEEVDNERPRPSASLSGYLWKAISSPFLEHRPPDFKTVFG